MRFLIQHTEHSASIETISSTSSISSIPHGCIVYVGFHRDDIHDYQTKIDRFVDKIQSAKLFRKKVAPGQGGGTHEVGGGSGKIDSSLTDTGGHILLVPNFTLYSRNQKGSGIDYTQSAGFADGQTMRDYLCQKLDESDTPHITGVFGAEMHITSTIDGPINHLREY